MAKSYGPLVKKAIALIDQYPASKQTLDDFIEDASKDLKDMEPQHREFVIIVVSGCIEQKKILDIIINSFYGHDGKHISKYFRSQFLVICYLTIFHFDELGLKDFSNIVRSLNIENMHNFLSFVFTNLTTWIEDELNCIYDAQYVKNHWIDPLLRRRSKIWMFIKRLGAGEMPNSPSKATEPVEFSFFNRKPPSRPHPELSPLPEKYIPVPNSMYTVPKEVQILDDLKQRNHQMTEELLYEANMTPFKCARPQKSENTMRAMAKIKEELDTKLKFNSIFKSQPSPSNKKTWPVKLNSATILRQRALHDRKVEEELQRLDNLVKGAYEPSSFLQWQKEMRDKEHREKTAMIDQKHADILISHLEIAMERTKATECKKRAARLKNEEASRMKLKTVQKIMQEVNEKRDLVQQVSENCKKNPKKAKEKVKKFKRSVVKEISEHSQELLRQAQEEAQAELDRKFEAISELHTIEYCPLTRLKYFDDTETAGHELLGELSHAEVKERLFFMKEADVNEQQKKRDCILEEKDKKQQLLLEDMDSINLHSRVMGMAAALRKEEEKEARFRLQQTQEETIMALRKKFEEKKQDYQKMKTILSKPSKQAAANTLKNTETHRKSGLKKINWEDLEQSLEEYIERKDSQIVSQRGPLRK
ncbi:cilia- and flagella-associated protein 99-like isoform X2 [Phycodurus eques]|uniref:cilia- and flagella-associated protein 99-like isoform X2 n=1 Tax=Phycodurus eques TaxID=693459 RepID=UPI002ACDAB88|nr:cilia- and flagella-associated protein 99-like isoform X2 [Phycodurus eques]